MKLNLLFVEQYHEYFRSQISINIIFRILKRLTRYVRKERWNNLGTYEEYYVHINPTKEINSCSSIRPQNWSHFSGISLADSREINKWTLFTISPCFLVFFLCHWLGRNNTVLPLVSQCKRPSRSHGPW